MRYALAVRDSQRVDGSKYYYSFPIFAIYEPKDGLTENGGPEKGGPMKKVLAMTGKCRTTKI